MLPLYNDPCWLRRGGLGLLLLGLLATPLAAQSDKGNPSTAKKPTKVRVTVDLPSAYLAADVNGDNQLSYSEWRTLNRGSILEFQKLDLNGDGFLTPKELLKADVAAKDAKSSIKTAADSKSSATTPSTATGSASTPATGKPAEAPKTPPATATEDPMLAKAKTSFKAVDTDNDGKISPEEWQRSRFTRKLFEEAKIDLTKPMSSEEFLQHYQKLAPKDGR